MQLAVRISPNHPLAVMTDFVGRLWLPASTTKAANGWGERRWEFDLQLDDCQWRRRK